MRLNPSTRSFTLLLGLCAGLPALSIDLSAPTLTILPTAVGTTIGVAGLSLSLFMVGFAAGQFAGGRTSDRIGRRPVLLASLTVYVLGGICCVLATSGPQLVAARLVQGLGAGACAVQAAAMVQDLFVGEAARRKQSYVSVVLTIMPMLAPALGALLIAHWGWRSVHVILVFAGVLLAAAITMFVAESRRRDQAQASRGLGLGDSMRILRGPAFRRIALVNSLSYGALFAYIAGAPVVVMTDLGQPALVYASLFAATALALAGGATSNAALGRRGIDSERLVWPALLAQAGSTIVLLLAGIHFLDAGVWAAIPALIVCAFARGMLSPNFIHLALSRHRDRAGLASALVGVSQLLVGALASAVVAALLASSGYRGVAIPMAVLACSAASVWRLTDGRVREGDRVD